MSFISTQLQFEPNCSNKPNKNYFHIYLIFRFHVYDLKLHRCSFTHIHRQQMKNITSNTPVVHIMRHVILKEPCFTKPTHHLYAFAQVPHRSTTTLTTTQHWWKHSTPPRPLIALATLCIPNIDGTTVSQAQRCVSFALANTWTYALFCFMCF